MAVKLRTLYFILGVSNRIAPRIAKEPFLRAYGLRMMKVAAPCARWWHC